MFKRNKNTILTRGLDKSTKIRSIKDPTIVWAEEADEIKEQDFVDTDLSIRTNKSKSFLQFILTFNPAEENCWINNMFFPQKAEYEKEDGSHTQVKSTMPSTIIIHSTYKTNRYCSKQNRETFDNIKYLNLERYRVSLLGLWGGNNEAIIFKDINYVDKFPKENERKHYGIGLDFGFSVDPSAAVECCISHGEIYLKELFYMRGLVNVTETADRQSIDKEFKKLGIKDNVEIFADNAEPKSIQELKDAGYFIKGAEKGKDSIQAGITGLKSYKINVVSSPNLKKEFNNYSYKEDKDGNLTNVPINAFGHLIDASRYWYREAVSRYHELGIIVL
jgi:phage terminase large subunit